ncbi:TetR/AcrR family transcriptional regulator [Dactylosporangium sp. NPDC051541]|uniref:TetR/AcrR family transcriptional regulator n=1 Tax=Dactylosporangium sp. NPDC051541 TaxID=3363977 RepID=UPI003788B592
MPKPGPRGILSDDVIVDAALLLLDTRGPEAMSMRGIATQLGVAPNALYTYFPDKAAVLRAVVDRLIGTHADLSALADSSGLPRARIRTLALGLRAGLIRHPGAASVLLGAPMDGPQAMLLGEHLLSALADAGVEGPSGARASYLIIVYLLGSVALEALELDPTRPAPPEEDRIAARRQAFDRVPAELFPRTAAEAATMATYIGTEQFTWGLDRLLDGLGVPA